MLQISLLKRVCGLDVSSARSIAHRFNRTMQVAVGGSEAQSEERNGSQRVLIALSKLSSLRTLAVGALAAGVSSVVDGTLQDESGTSCIMQSDDAARQSEECSRIKILSWTGRGTIAIR